MKNCELLRTAGSLFALVGNCVTVSVTYSCTCAVKCKVTSPSKAISKEISKEFIQFSGSEEQLTKEENKITLLYRAELNCGPVANTTLVTSVLRVVLENSKPFGRNVGENQRLADKGS